MTDVLRALNAKGLAAFDHYISRMASAAGTRPPFEILKDIEFSESFEPTVEIDREPLGSRFPNRFEFGTYLCAKLRNIEQATIVRHYGMWNWLSLYYFDQICPVSPDGSRRLLARELYILSPTQIYRQYFRHLVRSPWLIVRDHDEHAKILLISSDRNDEAPLAGRGAIFEQLASRQNILNNQTTIAAAHSLYFDDRTGRPRYAAAGSGAGAIRRYALVVQQLELTYDTRACSVAQFLELLPKEFDDWKRRAHLDQGRLI